MTHQYDNLKNDTGNSKSEFSYTSWHYRRLRQALNSFFDTKSTARYASLPCTPKIQEAASGRFLNSIK